jgi:hypothetical protein
MTIWNGGAILSCGARIQLIFLLIHFLSCEGFHKSTIPFRGIFIDFFDFCKLFFYFFYFCKLFYFFDFWIDFWQNFPGAKNLTMFTQPPNERHAFTSQQFFSASF